MTTAKQDFLARMAAAGLSDRARVLVEITARHGDDTHLNAGDEFFADIAATFGVTPEAAKAAFTGVFGEGQP